MLVLGLINIPWWGILLCLIAAYIAFSMRNFGCFKKQGIKGPQPWPIVGTLHIMLSGRALPYIERENIDKYGNKVIGGFIGAIPSITVYDEDMLSDIMVKEFHSFTNRLTFKGNSPASDNMVANLEDEHWKRVRNQMTPTFTTGKLKLMNKEINRCATTLVDSLCEQAKTAQIVEMKEYSGGYTMDVIASTAFGIRVDSQKDRNNDFVKHAKDTFAINAANPVLILFLFFPEVASLLVKLGLVVSILGKDTIAFFAKVTKQAMTLRKSEDDTGSESRSDFLQLMIKAQRGENIHDDDDSERRGKEKTSGPCITTDEILSNAMLFFVAGYDTTSTSLSFFLHNMACHPEIQEKLVAEINDILGNSDAVEANHLYDLPYLDQCINENLRLYPPALRVNRIAKRDITIGGVCIQKGTVVHIPIYGIHMDPEKWPEPDTYDPERFSPENKAKRNPFHFLPFGYGPRNCIGIRLALQELKVAVVMVLRKVKFSTCEKTQNPVKFVYNATFMKAESLYLRVEPRT